MNTTQDDVSNRSIPKTVGFELMMKSVRKFEVSESLRDCVNTTQDDVSNRSIPKTAGFELMMKSVRKIRSVRITSRLREYYSGRCEQSIDTQDSGVRAHDEKCPKNSKCPNLRDCVNTTQDDVSNRSIPKTAGFELMMKSVRINGSLELSESLRGLREYYSGRCEQSIDTQDSGVRAHDEKCPKNSKCPNHFAIA